MLVLRDGCDFITCATVIYELISNFLQNKASTVTAKNASMDNAFTGNASTGCFFFKKDST